MSTTNTPSADRETVHSILDAEFPDRIFAVEGDVVWVSGMNQNCSFYAHSMAEHLAREHDISTGLVHDDDALCHGGVQFNWGDDA